MICSTCATAADAHAPAGQHCDATGGPGARCDCAHRTDRYRPAPPPGLVAVAAFYDQLAALIPAELPWPPPDSAMDACPCGGTTSQHAPDCPIHPVRLRAAAAAADALLPPEARAAGLHFEWADDVTERCRAEFHEPNRPDGHCDLPAGHTEHHRDRSLPGDLHWTDDVAIYPTDTTKD